MKHKSPDYKLSAVKYYLDIKLSMNDVCDIYQCSKTSLKKWVDRYKKNGSIKRHDRKAISYKITKNEVNYAITRLVPIGNSPV